MTPMKGKRRVRIGQGEAWAMAVFGVLANHVRVPYECVHVFWDCHPGLCSQQCYWFHEFILLFTQEEIFFFVGSFLACMLVEHRYGAYGHYLAATEPLLKLSSWMQCSSWTSLRSMCLAESHAMFYLQLQDPLINMPHTCKENWQEVCKRSNATCKLQNIELAHSVEEFYCPLPAQSALWTKKQSNRALRRALGPGCHSPSAWWALSFHLVRLSHDAPILLHFSLYSILNKW